MFAAVLAAAVIVNRDLYRLFYDQGGFRLAVCGFMLQQLYYIYSIAGLAAGLLIHCIRKMWKGNPALDCGPARPVAKVMAAQRLKVLFITNWYPTKDAPVKAVWVREHAKAARLYDDIVVLHCPGPDASLPRAWRIEKEADEAFAEGVPAYRVWYRPSPISTLSYFMYLWCIFRSFRYIVNQGFDPDVIHVHIYDAGVPALLIGKLDGIPVVVTEHFSSFPRRSLGRLDWCKAWLAFGWQV